MDGLIANDDLEMSFNGQQMAELHQSEDLISDMGQPKHLSASADCCTVTNLLTTLMDNFIAKPILKYRYLVLFIYLAITSLSIGAITQLKTASGRPELFPSNTNLQKLLNLQFNFSSSYIDCSSCSGDLLPVHRTARMNRYRFPVKRSIDGLKVLMNGTQASNGSELHWTSAYLTTEANTTASTAQVDFSVNRTESHRHIVSSVGMEESPVTNISLDKTTRTTETTTKSKLISLSNPKKTSMFERPTGSSLGTDKRSYTGRESSSTDLLEKFSKAMTTPLATLSTHYHNTTLVTSVGKQPITTHMAKTTEVQKQWTPMDERKSTAEVAASQRTIIQTTPPLCPKPCRPVERPIVDKTAIVFLVFGVKGVTQSTSKGKHFFETNRVRVVTCINIYTICTSQISPLCVI